MYKYNNMSLRWSVFITSVSYESTTDKEEANFGGHSALTISESQVSSVGKKNEQYFTSEICRQVQ